MARREKKMEKEKVPPPELRVRDPMSVVVEKLGDRSAQVHGDLSKETLRELLMSSVMLVPTAQSTISSSFREMLDSRKGNIGTQRQYIARDKKQKNLLRKERKTKKKTRTRMKMWDDVPWSRDGKWDRYDEASTDEEIEKEILEDEEEDAQVETLPSCPSSLTEELNLSYDGKWLRSNMKFPLKMALKEIVAKKPYDPVGYLGFWLLNYKKCQEDNKRRLELDEELSRLRCLIKQPTPEEGTIVEQEAFQVEEGEEEGNVNVDWNFQFYTNNQ